MRYLWRVYYLFVKPINKSDIAVAYSRKNGKPYKILKLAKTKDLLDEDL